MKTNWLLYLVIFSLALNLGTIGTFAYLHYQDYRPGPMRPEQPPLPLRGLWQELNMDAAQRQALRGLFPEHRCKVRDLRQELAGKRLELFELIKSEPTRWDAVQAKVREISTLQGGLEEEMVRFLLELRKNLKPEQQAAFLNFVQARLGRALGGPFGPMGPGRGRMHGGMGPRGPGGGECLK